MTGRYWATQLAVRSAGVGAFRALRDRRRICLEGGAAVRGRGRIRARDIAPDWFDIADLG